VSTVSSVVRALAEHGAGAPKAYTPALMGADDTDEALMLRYAQGDAAAFDALYGRHRGGVFRYLLRQLNSNRTAAEELFQDVWMNLIGARARYRVEAKFTTWLYTLAHNRVIDHYRRHRPLEVVSLDDGDEDDPPELAAPATVQPERAAEARQQAARLLALVDALPPAQREAFLLHEEGGLSLEEIAAVTGADREAVKSRLRYAMDKLRRGMGDLL
jgi:RNA polymerase sigma-70 factor (ECF subfamily)